MPHAVQIRPREWRWACCWSLLILLLSCLPYLIATQLAPEGWQFAGILVNPFDAHSYLAKMQQGAQGKWLFHLTYTPEPHQGAFIFTFYLALGHLAALTGLPLIWVFHGARLAAGFCLLLLAYRFIARVTPDFHERRLAFIFMGSASGLGWLGAIFGAFPIDLWVPEAFVPYSLFTNPHFPLGMALMLVIFQLVAWPGGAKGRMSEHSPAFHSPAQPTKATEAKPLAQHQFSILGAGLAGLALALILPFALLAVWAVLAVYLGWLYRVQRRLPWSQIWPTLGLGLFSAPVIVYDYWVSTTNPILAGWSAQNVTQAPSPLNFLLGYGVTGLLAGLGGGLIVRKKGEQPEAGEWLVLLWAVTTIILVYLPFNLQRRLISGLHIPLCILAAIGLARWLEQCSVKAGYRRLITGSAIMVGALGTLFVWGIPLLGLRQAPAESETAALFFLRREEIAALDWLRENNTSDETVLASPRLGMFVPGRTGARVFYGHPFETIKAEAKKAMVEAFYRGQIERVSPPVTFIIYGPSEQALGRPRKLAADEIVFSTENLTIYRPAP